MKRRVRMLLGPCKGTELEYPRVEAENLVATGWASWADAPAPEAAEPGGTPAQTPKPSTKKTSARKK